MKYLPRWVRLRGPAAILARLLHYGFASHPPIPSEVTLYDLTMSDPRIIMARGRIRIAIRQAVKLSLSVWTLEVLTQTSPEKELVTRLVAQLYGDPERYQVLRDLVRVVGPQGLVNHLLVSDNNGHPTAPEIQENP